PGYRILRQRSRPAGARGVARHREHRRCSAYGRPPSPWARPSARLPATTAWPRRAVAAVRDEAPTGSAGRERPWPARPRRVAGAPGGRTRSLDRERRGQRCGWRAALPYGRVRATIDGHWITSSARTSIDRGMLTPRALAVLRLIRNSNWVACSTGRSPGLAPLRILSTYTAARRHAPATFVP